VSSLPSGQFFQTVLKPTAFGCEFFAKISHQLWQSIGRKNTAEKKDFWFITALSQRSEHTKKPVTKFPKRTRMISISSGLES
jgi:hypothetical protein